MMVLFRLHAFVALLAVGNVAGQCTICASDLTRPDLVTPFTQGSVSDGSISVPSLDTVPGIGPIERFLELEGDVPVGHRGLMDAPDDLLSCQELDDLLSQLPDAVCPEQNATATLSYICGCPEAERPPPMREDCNGICFEGSPTVPDATPLGPLLDTTGGGLASLEPFRFATCEFFDYVLKLETASDCSFMQSFSLVSAPCGCGGGGVEPSLTCGLCGMGVELPDYTILPEISETTQSFCQIVDLGLSLEHSADEASCMAELATDTYVGLQDACGCNGAPTGVGACPVCPGGMEPTLPENEIFSLFNLTGTGESDVVTCESASSVFGVFAVFGGLESCELLPFYGSLFCGCPPTDEGLRSFCPDGMVSTAPGKLVPQAVEDLLVGIFLEDTGPLQLNEAALEDGLTCGEVGNMLSVLGSGGPLFESSIPVDCECPGYTEVTCPICSDGSPVADASVDLDGIGFTCGQFAVSLGLANDTSCSAGVAMEPYCGCPATVASDAACRLCGDGVLLENPSLGVETGISCFDAEMDANYAVALDPMDASICAEYQNNFASECCDGAVAMPTAAPGPTMMPGNGTEAPAVAMPTAVPAPTMTTGNGTEAPAMITEAPSASPSGGSTPPTASPVVEPAESPTVSPTTSEATSFTVSVATLLSLMALSFICV
eukprot:CAMPEP_0194030576 /NCGR_PEP_ID=MMETSP0009_2-20130614/4003_1 /TAXON_ID=210454 /ORGANISM="Grammatophora oceanica, Strain CCMP 410" /LENGTH=662 /DNA_ID=CAMNT_0038670543 /DNA_START=94 /DNA_END=2082 /DNA_ORIENTATION=-